MRRRRAQAGIRSVGAARQVPRAVQIEVSMETSICERRTPPPKASECFSAAQQSRASCAAGERQGITGSFAPASRGFLRAGPLLSGAGRRIGALGGWSVRWAVLASLGVRSGPSPDPLMMTTLAGQIGPLAYKGCNGGCGVVRGPSLFSEIRTWVDSTAATPIRLVSARRRPRRRPARRVAPKRRAPLVRVSPEPRAPELPEPSPAS